jgi:hypothetical protein
MPHAERQVATHTKQHSGERNRVAVGFERISCSVGLVVQCAERCDDAVGTPPAANQANSNSEQITAVCGQSHLRTHTNATAATSRTTASRIALDTEPAVRRDWRVCGNVPTIALEWPHVGCSVHGVLGIQGRSAGGRWSDSIQAWSAATWNGASRKALANTVRCHMLPHGLNEFGAVCGNDQLGGPVLSHSTQGIVEVYLYPPMTLVLIVEISRWCGRV